MQAELHHAVSTSSNAGKQEQWGTGVSAVLVLSQHPLGQPTSLWGFSNVLNQDNNLPLTAVRVRRGFALRQVHIAIPQ